MRESPVQTACGKVILLGEHAVVYGRPAIAAGLARGAEAAFEPGEPAGGVVLEVPAWGLRAARGGPTDVGRALAALCDALPGGAPAGVVRASVRVPAGGGLGSSAALGVAVARALAPGLAPDAVLTAALAWERVFHGNPSGIDHAVAARGGAGIFTRAAGFVPLALRAPLRLLVADTGERASTRDMVAGLAARHAGAPAATETAFDAIAALVHDAAAALVAGDAVRLGARMSANQALLASLGLSTARTDALCAAARAAGALGAKLTGGGGGGCVIALAGAREAEVLAAWAAAGAPGFAAVVTSESSEGAG